MKGWTGFLALAPEKVREVIEEGPFPQVEYAGGQKITPRDKRMGIMRFKGGTGRGGIPMTKHHQGVVYYDPEFASPEYQPNDIPQEVLDRHSRDNIEAEFAKL